MQFEYDNILNPFYYFSFISETRIKATNYFSLVSESRIEDMDYFLQRKYSPGTREILVPELLRDFHVFSQYKYTLNFLSGC